MAHLKEVLGLKPILATATTLAGRRYPHTYCGAAFRAFRDTCDTQRIASQKVGIKETRYSAFVTGRDLPTIEEMELLLNAARAAGMTAWGTEHVLTWHERDTQIRARWHKHDRRYSKPKASEPIGAVDQEEEEEETEEEPEGKPIGRLVGTRVPPLTVAEAFVRRVFGLPSNARLAEQVGRVGLRDLAREIAILVEDERSDV